MAAEFNIQIRLFDGAFGGVFGPHMADGLAG
jgi:hypothetical protein